jgi:hypothetical protein
MRAITFLIIMVMANNLFGQEFLEPESSLLSSDSVRDEYYLATKRYLLHDLTSSPTARAIAIPSFSSEYVVSIENDSEGFFIFFRTFSKPIFQEYKSKTMDKAIKVEYKNRIDSTLAAQLHELFYISVSEAKFPPFEYVTIPFGKNVGKKSRTHISAFERGFRSGKTWSPKAGTKMAKLVHIVNLMKAFSYDKKYENQLKESTNKLLKEME